MRPKFAHNRSTQANDGTPSDFSHGPVNQQVRLIDQCIQSSTLVLIPLDVGGTSDANANHMLILTLSRLTM